MTAFFMPPLGTKITLTQDWMFPLYVERRNKGVHVALVGAWPSNWYRMSEVSNPVTLPAGTVLVIDRIYIRNGLGDFDSLTFRITSSPDRRLMSVSKGGTFRGQARFWARLTDINGRLHGEIAIPEDVS